MAIRGLESRHEQISQQMMRDTRTLAQRLYAFISSPHGAAILLFTFGSSATLVPAIADLCFLLGLIIFAISYLHRSSLPFRMPLASGAQDHNDPIPGSTKGRKARGISFFGNDRKTSEELWFNNDDLRTHVLIFGSTGSGKTEALVSIAYNSLLQGSGFIYVDGKGDNSLFAKIFSMARRMGREDDLLLVNFMTGARDIIGAQKNRLSNTMNPFSRGSSSMLTQLVVSLMDSGGPSASPDGDMWKNRAIAFVEALMRILVYARDKEYILLDAHTVRKYFLLTRLESIAIDKKFPVDDKDNTVSLEDAPEIVLDPIKNYLNTLPGYTEANKYKQNSEVWEQHGFIVMQLTRVFSSLADTYGHIIRTKLAEVDFKDVVLNRRILCVLLPALEKSPEELSNLGKVIVASLKAMMAAGLGENVEGTYKDVVQSKPTNAPTPYVCILDEYGYYAVKGFSVVPAQARSLGFSTVFAGQDLPAFQKASKEEAASIGANTNIKICMKLEDPLETWDFFQKSAGEADVTKTGGFQVGSSSLTNSYLDSKSAQVERRARIDLLDLKDQREGEGHIFFKSRIVRARMFFANPKPTKALRINQFLKVDEPSGAVVAEISQRLHRFHEVFENPNFLYEPAPHDEDIEQLLEVLAESAQQSPIESAFHCLAEMHKLHMLSYDDGDDINSDEAGHYVDIFTSPPQTDDDTLEFFSLMNVSSTDPLVIRNELRRQVEHIERLCGKSKQDARAIAGKLIRDMHNTTRYLPNQDIRSDRQTILHTLNALTHALEHLKHNPPPPPDPNAPEPDANSEGDSGGSGATTVATPPPAPATGDAAPADTTAEEPMSFFDDDIDEDAFADFSELDDFLEEEDEPSETPLENEGDSANETFSVDEDEEASHIFASSEPLDGDASDGTSAPAQEETLDSLVEDEEPLTADEEETSAEHGDEDDHFSLDDLDFDFDDDEDEEK